MNYYNNKNKVTKKNDEHSGINKRLTTRIVTLSLITLLLISAPITIFSTQVLAEEVPLSSILTELNFTNLALSDLETFPSGIYQATLLAEFGGYHEVATLSYYTVETSDYQTIFEGLEGATGFWGGYVVPPVSKVFLVDSQFGFSMMAAYRYFTENGRNPDYPIQHAQIYQNIDLPNMFVICFEDVLGGYDMDYNDMVFSLTQLFPPEIVSVIRSPVSPTSDQPVTITAQVTKGTDQIDSVILSYQIDSSSWTNLTMNLDGNNYVTDIPGQQINTQVNYKVYASDTNGYSDVSTLHTYTVGILSRSPIAVLINSPSVVYTNEVVDFDASGSYDPDGNIVSYIWDFGDETTASAKIVSHTFQDDGEYPVILRVVDDEGLISSKVVIQKVKNRPPVAALTETASVANNNETVSFDASPSYDLDGTIIAYTWSFGDGTAATGITITHNYPNSGFYRVTLTVNDNDGATDERQHSLIVTTIGNNPPVAMMTKTAETVNIDETLSFNASESYDSDGSIIGYSWDFDDGTMAPGETAEHAYSEAGTYTVTLTVTDNDGVTDNTSSSVNITNPPITNQSPVASFTQSAQTVSIGEYIHFDGSESNDPDGSTLSYTWDFGDGTTATGMEVDHSYEAEGVYTVTLTIMNINNLSDETTHSVTITKINPNEANVSPIAIFTESADIVYVNDPITFNAADSYDPNGTIVSYSWDFGDGTIATGVEVNHTFEDDDIYTVTLTVTDNDDATGSATATINVMNRLPIALFTENATTITQNEAIRFDASESYDLDGTIVAYSWDFSDGTAATGVATEHAYSEAGTYIVTLTIIDDDGASSSLIDEMTVERDAETGVSLDSISGIVLGITALAMMLLYVFFIRKKKKKQSNEV